ncbi:MAG: hypothetical protein JW943_13675 [Deltaproteobacteria bacterium]|nr:hypothetical protein [Deltaproteobacteria bacterium]
MYAKEAAKDVIDSMPNESSMDDIIHALYVRLKFEHGENEIHDGKGVLNQEAKQRLQKWLR